MARTSRLLIRPDVQPIAPLLWCIGAFLSGMLLHIDRVPLWTSAVAILCVSWRMGAAMRGWPLPGKLLRAIITLALALAVLSTFRTLNGLSAGSALLVAMGSSKLLETNSRRDYFIVVGTCLFVLLAACLDRQSLLRTPLYVVHAWICCTALAVASYGESRKGIFDSRAAMTLAARSLLFSIPLALLLFLFFPRIPAAFWVLPNSGSGATGLSDTMSPGSITDLTENDTIAFRVSFDGDIPPPYERYWRGPVLHDFDGYTWSRSISHSYRQPALEYLGKPYRYRISLEPHAERWWFALDTVTQSPRRDVYLTYDYQLVGSAPVTQTTTYEAVSYTRTRTDSPISLLALRYDTALPANRNPRSRELARQMRRDAGTDTAFVKATLDMFRTGGFEYTLTPPRLDLNSVDDFIFNTRKGFCGHFASAFVMMMRAGGVPARVVTGYLGGEWNPIGRYFLVRQSEAHAWAEVWVHGQGWSRVDPTGVVSPERLNRGIMDVIPSAGSVQARLVHRTPWLSDMLQRWDALNSLWNNKVVKFDLGMQLQLLSKLGIDTPEWRHLGWGLALGFTGWLLWIAWQMKAFRGGGAARDRVARAYAKLCAKLARVGVPRAAHQGPLEYSGIVAAQRPDLQASVSPLLLRYAELRFANASIDPDDISRFEREVRRLRVSAARAP